MSPHSGRPTKPRCSFCGREAGQVQRLISGPSVHICNECVKLCSQILVAEELNHTQSFEMRRLPPPSEIKAFLDDYVIGQQQAKKSIAVAVYNHYKRIRHYKKRIRSKSTKDEVDLEKSNILLLGPTGTGKTLLAQTLAKMLHVPFAIVDATVLTEAGYVGEDVENILVRLFQSADFDVGKTEMGIVYIDELDKIARKGAANPSITRDVSGEGVQQALLKLLEGTTAHIPPHGGRKHPEQPLVEINTGNILFICGGAFEGLEEIVRTRLGKRVVGFAAEGRRKSLESVGEILAKVQPEDLLAYGLIPELIGRLPVVNSLDELDSEALLKILVQPKNALTKQYQKFFDMERIRLKFAPDALRAVVDKAMKWGTGARALRSVMEEAMLDIMYHIPSRSDVKECLITKEVILDNAEPVYLLKEERKRA